MRRGFGIDAGVPAAVAADVASRAELLGFESFWVNGSPPRAALESIAAAAESSRLQLGIGVLPLTSISIGEIVSEIQERALPQQRLWLGVGSSRVPGALAEVSKAVEVMRAELEVRVVAAAVGPKMTELAGEVADIVLFTWWPRGEVAASRTLVEAGARRAQRPVPSVASYVRCALVPDAAGAIAEQAGRYAAIPRYADVFARNHVGAADTVVTGLTAADLAPRIEYEEAVLDLPVIRAITAEDTLASITPLLEACAPTEP